jgi:hypothetical protein
MSGWLFWKKYASHEVEDVYMSIPPWIWILEKSEYNESSEREWPVSYKASDPLCYYIWNYGVILRFWKLLILDINPWTIPKVESDITALNFASINPPINISLEQMLRSYSQLILHSVTLEGKYLGYPGKKHRKIKKGNLRESDRHLLAQLKSWCAFTFSYLGWFCYYCKS